MQKISLILALTAIFFLFGCENAKFKLDLNDGTPTPVEATASPTPKPSATPSPSAPASSIALSWDTTDERKAWSKELLSLAEKYKPSFANAKDRADFCPKFAELTPARQTAAFAEFLLGIIYFESSYIPTKWYTETAMGMDSVTKKQIVSEGFFQLSYQDVKGYPYCEFDYSKDKGLGMSDPKKTILDPYKNLRCGVRIFNHLATQNVAISQQAFDAVKGKTVYKGGARYWSVLREQKRRGQIIDRLKTRAKGCF